MVIELFDLLLLLWLTLLTGFGLASFAFAWMTHYRHLCYLDAREQVDQPAQSRVLVDRRSTRGTDFLINRTQILSSTLQSPSLLKNSHLQNSASLQSEPLTRSN
jgi:hypothetical protein